MKNKPSWLSEFLLTISNIISFSPNFSGFPEKAFFNIYLPVLILIPQVFTTNILAPNLSSAQMTIIPIFLVFIFSRLQRWKFSLNDLLVTGYAGACIYSEYRSGEKYLFLVAQFLCSVIAPYFLAKTLITSSQLDVRFAQRLVFLVFVDVLIASFEFRFQFNPLITLPAHYFNVQREWYTSYRYGLPRIAEAFAHPILFAIGISIAFLLNYWLVKNKFWSKNFKHLPSLFLSKGMIIAFVLIIGLILTFSRGPLLSCIFGTLVIGAGFSKHRLRSLALRALIAVIFAVMIYYSFHQYLQMGQKMASDTEQTAIYRINLWNEYLKLIWMQPIWGWGQQVWLREEIFLVEKHTFSVDNAYLYLTLLHGFVSTALFTAVGFWAMLRLAFYGIFQPLKNVQLSSLMFALLAVILTILLSLTTVYMGLQIEPLFFIAIGWAEGVMLANPNKLQNILEQQTYVFQPRLAEEYKPVQRSQET